MLHKTPIKEQPTIGLHSQGAWEGSNYDRNLDIKEIAKRVREGLKIKYPKTKFSITIERYAGGRSLKVAVMESDIKMFVSDDPTQQNVSPNKYYLEQESTITDEGKEMLSFIKALVGSFNYDDSDSMTDYFSVNFYSDIRIGKWDKPFIQK